MGKIKFYRDCYSFHSISSLADSVSKVTMSVEISVCAISYTFVKSFLAEASRGFNIFCDFLTRVSPTTNYFVIFNQVDLPTISIL